MIFIFLSICCSVFVSVLLKLAKRYHIDANQAIAWNYLAAGSLCWVFYRPDISSLNMQAIPYPIYILLGLLLPGLFVILALSVRYSGIVRTDVAQRLSLFIPVIAAFLLFKETPSIMKSAGIAVGFAAILFSIPWQKQDKSSTSSGWIYLLIVFVGLGIIDVLFKQIAQNKVIPYTSSLQIIFILAFLISVIALAVMFITGKLKFEWINFICGIILGMANFGNILFYLKAHQSLAQQPSVVFSAMNIGVIILGSIVGILIFREKLSRLNYAGIALALISIILVVLS
ncbi:DMT family transporter [Flavihumibacter sp. R14]|nr:DMT family transporter [Flavihumibacter soli]